MPAVKQYNWCYSKVTESVARYCSLVHVPGLYFDIRIYFLGLTLASTKQEMLRAVLESISFSEKHLVEAFLQETDYKFEKLVIDGGVARNNFIVQMIANLTGND